MKTLLKILLPCSLLFHSCSEKNDEQKITDKSDTSVVSKNENPSGAGFKESGTDFNISYSEPRRIYSILRDDLNSDGKNEIIVLSIAREDEYDKYDYFNFDMMEVFMLDEKSKSFKKIVSDTVDYSTECEITEIEGSKNKQIIIKTYTGGNDKIISNGMFVYGVTDSNKIEQLKYFDSGDPRLQDVNKNGSNEILVSDEYSGSLAKADKIIFVKDIYRLDKNRLIRSNNKYSVFYEEKISEAEKKYNEAKDKLQFGMQAQDFSPVVFSEAVTLIVNYSAKGDGDNLKKFWNEEKDFLQKNLSYDEFMDLKNLVTKLQPIARE